MPKSKVRKRKDGTKARYEEVFTVNWEAAEEFVKQARAGKIPTSLTADELDELDTEIKRATSWRRTAEELGVDPETVNENTILINPEFLNRPGKD